MPTLDEVFPSKYLKAIDIKAPMTVTIGDVVWELVGVEQERKQVMYFTEAFTNPKKGLSLNKTNFIELAMITGQENSDGWKGYTVELYTVATTDRAGRPARGIRCRPAPGGAVVQPQASSVSPSEWRGIFSDEIPDPGEPMTAPQKKRASA